MIQSIIATLFAVYCVSSANRLLQQVQVVLPPQSLAPQGELICDVPYTEPERSCAGKPTALVNPANKLKINCDALGACAQAEITLDYLPGGVVQEIEGLWCGGTYSCYKTEVVINNLQGGSPMKLNRIECSEPGACDGMNIHLNNVDLGDVECYLSNCPNCMIYEAGNVDPTGKPIGTPCAGY